MARENTTNRGYRLPVPGDTDDWGNILNDETFEDIDEDVSQKTAEQAHTKEGPGERAGKDPDEDIRTAGEKLSESYDKLGEDTDEAVNRWG